MAAALLGFPRAIVPWHLLIVVGGDTLVLIKSCKTVKSHDLLIALDQ